MSGFYSSPDDLRLLGLMRIARNRCCGCSWESIESGLKEDWDVLRASDSSPWHEIANRLRAYCEDYGLLKEPAQAAEPTRRQSELSSAVGPGGTR